MAVKPEIAALTQQLEGQLIEALDTVEHISQRIRYMKGAVSARTTAILADLDKPYQDPRDTVVGAIEMGPTEEQPAR